jgi:ketosteroid isomerase-like protein
MPTPPEIEAKIRATLDAFARAWAARDLDAIMQCLTDDCVYGASVGPEPGATYRGQVEVRAGIAAMLTHDSAVESQTTGLVIAGDRAFWEWRYVQIGADGARRLLHGCDLFTFAGDKIAVKQAFRKVAAG